MFYGKFVLGQEKIAVVGVNGNPMAKRIVEEMKAQGMKGVVELDAPKAYPDYYALSQLEPDYVLFVYESAQCKVKITRVEGLLGDRLGHNVRRDTEESRQAQSYYKHQLKMIGIDPILLGAEEIPLREVKDIPWFYTSKGADAAPASAKSRGRRKGGVQSCAGLF